jgi:hypothetical protein
MTAILIAYVILLGHDCFLLVFERCAGDFDSAAILSLRASENTLLSCRGSDDPYDATDISGEPA